MVYYQIPRWYGALDSVLLHRTTKEALRRVIGQLPRYTWLFKVCSNDRVVLRVETKT